MLALPFRTESAIRVLIGVFLLFTPSQMDGVSMGGLRDITRGPSIVDGVLDQKIWHIFNQGLRLRVRIGERELRL